MSNNNDLRSNLLSGATFRKKVVKDGDNEYEVRQPSQASRMEIFEKAKGANGDLNNFKFLVWGVIYLTYDPKTGKRVLEDTDFDALMNQPAGGFVDKLGEAVTDVLGVDEDEAKK